RSKRDLRSYVCSSDLKFILVSGTDELKAILPPEAHFLFKLDYRVGSILCVARVQYGDAQYELNQGYTEEDRRDVEKETAAWKHKIGRASCRESESRDH